MKIHCICLVKDEEDILEQTINSALNWADHIYIADNGSSDKTPQIIDMLTDNIRVFKITGFENVRYRVSLWGLIFNQVKAVSKPGDWWCRLDADEFYFDNPKNFLASMPKQIDTVWSSHYSYQFSDVDFEKYQENPHSFLATPITDRIKHYLNSGGEVRFAKHRFPFYWRGAWPNLRFCASTRRIRIKQYQYRSPDQILTRLKNRQNLNRSFTHEDMSGVDPQEWLSQRIRSSEKLDYDDGGPLIERKDLHYGIWPLKPEKFPYWLWVSWLILQRPLHKLGLKKEVR